MSGETSQEPSQQRPQDPRPAGKLDDALQREIDDALGDVSLEDLMYSQQAPAAAAVDGTDGSSGGTTKGTVVGLDEESIFVSLGAKDQGIVPVSQFVDDPLPQIGETIEFVIIGRDKREDLLLLSLPGAPVEADWDTLSEGQIVEGRVTGYNKGGLELKVNAIDAFMPISQIEIFRVDDISGYVEQRLTCQVTEVDRFGQNLIVSRRDVLEAEAEQKREELLASLAEGKTVTGVVRNIMPYGAFVDIGGVDGLLHISDMSHGHVDDAQSVVTVGQQLELLVLKMDEDTGKIALGLKQLLPDPWQRAAEKWHQHDVVAGRITRLTDFGAFVQLEPGVEGLIPMGQLAHGRRIQRASDVASVSDGVRVRIMLVDLERRRISLSLKEAGDDPWIGASLRWPAGSAVEGTVTRITDFGAFVELAPGVEGLIHISELSAGRVRAVGDVVTEDEPVQATVLSVDESGHRMSLSISKLTSAGGLSPDDSDQSDESPTAGRPKRKRPLKGGLD